MKLQHRTETVPRRLPLPELNASNTDKGRKHESFESSSFGFDRRSKALAQKLDRKR